MEILNAPDPKDVPSFRFIQMRRIQVGDQISIPDPAAKGTTQLLAVGNKSEVLFVGVQNGLYFTTLSQVEDLDSAVKQKELRRVPVRSDPSQSILIPLPVTPSHLALSNDDLTLCIALNIDSITKIFLYDTRSFIVNRGTPDKILPFSQIESFNPPDTLVRDLQWNPVTSNLLAVTFSNNSLALFSISDGSKNHECWTLPPGEGITCINWSPKGKQLVAGRLNGSLTQYKPDLKEAKTIPGPNQDFSAVSILWVSTYQFLVGYKNIADSNSRAGLYFVQSGKAGPPKFTFFDDICYSTGSDRIPNFSAISIADWGVICVASANSIELGVLGSEDKEQLQWVQWTQPDDGRAEIPLSSDKAEQFPLGIAVSFTAKQKLVIGELPLQTSMPVVFILAPDGVLYGFYVVNQSPQAPQVTKPSEEISVNGLRTRTIQLPQQRTSQSVPLQVPVQNQKLDAVAKPFKFDESSLQASPTQVKPLTKPVVPLAKEPSITQDSSKPIVKQDQRMQAKEEACCLAVAEEIRAFTKEMEQFKSRMALIDTKIGTDAEKEQLKAGVEKTENFLADMKDITATQSREVDATQRNTLELFAWVEEAKTRQMKLKDPKYRQIMKNRSLDQSSKRRLDVLESMVFNIDQQLNQVNQMLDLEWQKHVSKTRSKIVGNDSKDIIYKNILNNRNILDGEKRIVESLSKAVRALKITDSQIGNNSNKGPINQQLSDITQTFNEKTRLGSSHLHNSTVAEGNVTRGKASTTIPIASFSPEKQSALKNYLVAKGTTKICPMKSEVIDEAAILNLIKPAKENKEPKSQVLLDRLVEREVKEQKFAIPPKDTVTGEKSEEKLRQTFKAPFAGEPSFSSPAPQLSSSPMMPFSFGSPLGSKTDSTVSKPSLLPTSKDNTANKQVPSFGISSSSKQGAPSISSPFQMGFKQEPADTKPGSTKPPSSGFFENLSKGQDLSFSSPKVEPVQPSKNVGGFVFDLPTSSTTSEKIHKPEMAFSTSTLQFGRPPVPESGHKSPGSGTNITSTPMKTSSTSHSDKAQSQPTSVDSAESKVVAKSTPNQTSPSISSSPTVPKSGTSMGFSNVLGSATSSAPKAVTVMTTTVHGSLPSQNTGALFSSPKTGIKVSGELDKSLGFGSCDTAPSSASGTTPKEELSQPAAPPSIFAKPGTGPLVSSGIFDKSTAASPSIFGNAGKTSGSSMSNIFDNKSVPAPTSTSIFGGVQKPPSVFGTPTTTTTTSTTSIFGAGSSTSTSSSSSVFGGGASPPTSTSQGIFSGTNQVVSSTSTQGGLDSSSPASTSAPSIFGGSSPSTATAPSIFGASSGSGIFGGAASSAAPTTASIFGAASPATTTTPSAFGAALPAATATATASVFGSGSSTTRGIFGGPSTPSGVFGGSSQPTSTSLMSMSSLAANPDVFGGGSTVTTTSQSVFGGTGFSSKPSAATATSGSIFGGSLSSSATLSPGSSFGKTGASQTSIFGGSSPFGVSNQTTGSVFGSSSAGQPAAENPPSIFGNSPPSFSAGQASTFGGSTDAAASSMFSSGSFFGGLSQEKSTKNVFGSTNFGTPTSTTQNLFGASTNTTFGGTASTGVFGSPTPSSTASTFGSPGFGSGSASSSTFGGAPIFGGAPAFGGTPIFGGSPMLGTSNTVFGSGSSPLNDPPTFGSVFGSSTSAEPPSFGNVSSQTFGSLSQQGGSSFGTFGQQSTSTFGSPTPSSSSFNTWR